MHDVSDIILGGAGYAGLFRAVDEEVAQAGIAAAWDAGIRAFDTAPHYGAGSGEERLGRFLRTRPRTEYTLSTKVGRLLYDDPQAADGVDGFWGTPKRSRRRDYSALGVRRSLEDSLTRLGLDRVDLLLIHDPDDHQTKPAPPPRPNSSACGPKASSPASVSGSTMWMWRCDSSANPPSITC